MIFPHLDVGTTTLRPIDPLDGAGVHRFLDRHGLAGAVSRDVLTELWASSPGEVAAQFEVAPRDGGPPAGLSGLHRLDLNGGHVQAGVFVDPAAGAETGAAAAALTVNYAFSGWSVRKVYLWTVEQAVGELSGVSEIVRREATLRQFVHDRGELRDLNIFAVYREAWQSIGQDLLQRLSRPRTPC
ncbi:N-acetyltransferase [Nonomuraea sp. NPDC047897]|uniref:N-acetyltransferase n=1 Tax=Nonomuraea sp. NPDC047897 TaxID=3364346 RepID=UPI00371567AC